MLHFFVTEYFWGHLHPPFRDIFHHIFRDKVFSITFFVTKFIPNFMTFSVTLICSLYFSLWIETWHFVSFSSCFPHMHTFLWSFCVLWFYTEDVTKGLVNFKSVASKRDISFRFRHMHTFLWLFCVLRFYTILWHNSFFIYNCKTFTPFKT